MQSRGLVYVDLYSAFLDDENKLNKKYTNDGLHINGFSCKQMERNMWKKTINKKHFHKIATC
jgi:glutathione peroxidase-family protein